MEWISVKDQLPLEGKRVLAYAVKNDDFPYLDCSYFEAEQYRGRWTENVDACQIYVTHWMELPEPPKTE